MTAVSESHLPVACLTMAFTSSTTVTTADSPAGFDPETDVPALNKADEAAPDDVAERTEEPLDPADSSTEPVDRITVALIPKASDALLAVLGSAVISRGYSFLVLILLSLIAVGVTITAHSRDTLTFALILLAVFLCYGMRNDSDDHASVLRQANRMSAGSCSHV